MRFTLTIESDNVAMVEDPSEATAQTLVEVSNALGEGYTEGIVWDANGNRVGEWTLTT